VVLLTGPFYRAHGDLGSAASTTEGFRPLEQTLASHEELVAQAYGTAVPIGGGATFGKAPRKVDPRGPQRRPVSSIGTPLCRFLRAQ